MRNILKNRLVLITIAAIAIVLIYENIVFSNASYQYKEAYYESVHQNLTNTADLVVESYSGMSSMLVNILLTDEVTAMIDRANTASEIEQAIIRQALLTRYGAFYEDMQEIDFRQLHFHLLDAVSFARFHAPEKYGDSLSDVRESIVRVQETGEPTSGFEEGRINNGYRFVYPIFHENRLVGSVEASISYVTVDHLVGDVTGYRSVFLIDEKVVRDKVFPDERGHYDRLEDFPGYYVETLTEDFETIADSLGIEAEDLDEINLMVGESIGNGTYDEWGINIHTVDEMSIFTVIIPIRNYHDEVIAYSVYYGSEPVFYNTSQSDQINMALIYMLDIILVFALGVILYIMLKNRNNAYRDRLTQLYNREYFKEKVTSGINTDEETAVIMLDIDEFKKINENYGYEEGDRALRLIGGIIQESIRESDVPIRWGGEEFIIILRMTSEVRAQEIAERIKKAIGEYDFGEYRISASFGLTMYQDEDDIISFFLRVDENLEAAKRAGKNQTVVR